MMTPDHYHEREAEKVAKDYEESGAIVEMIKNKLSELADFSFVIGNFFTHCVTHHGKVVPAEGAVVEFSLEGGILAQWHCVLRSGPILSGYRGQCTENAKKTHNIPIGSIPYILICPICCLLFVHLYLFVHVCVFNSFVCIFAHFISCTLLVLALALQDIIHS